ncbi:Zn-dependent exopeptidase [Gyrodon lividus]|nr:Zn-dependent exopeptidase [Gyrodon lividus]
MKHGSKGPKGPLRGKEAEQLFLSIPDEESALAASRLYASKPHMAGSPGDLDTAKDFLALLQHELGIQQPSFEFPIFSAGTSKARAATLNVSSYTEPTAWIDTYYPILNSPLNHSLEILGDDGSPIWTAELEEVSDEADPYAAEYATAVLAWHGLSCGGEAQGKLVYVNYGRKQDYDELVAAGVDFTRKIVIARYGGIFRGLKVKRAQELGASAVLIYSDLRDDGTVTVENGYVPYPHGPARNPTSVQRGSVQFLSLYPGDPSTPGYPSYENSTRVEGKSKPTIPSLPISWANAEVLLKQIANGSEGPTVRLVNHVDEKITPIWNTMGVIPGHIKNEVVVLGNHRDGGASVIYNNFNFQVLGASDPSSGTVSVHEAIRGFGALLRNGWKPLRTILVASWDGEEYGLVGSTEWGEDFAEWIREHVVAYVNLDTSVSGSRLSASASPLLAHLLRSTAEQIPHPTSEGRSLWDARSDKGELYGENLDVEAIATYEEAQLAADSIGVNPLGSGSDYTVFLQYIGVPSSQAGFASTLHDPVYHYHSIFDSQHWQEVYGDPSFSRHVAIAKHIGLQVLRLSGNIVLPFNTTHYSLELESYLDKVEALSVAACLDVDFASLRESIQTLQAASTELDAEKVEAELELRKVLNRLKKGQAYRRKLRRKVRKGICKLKKLFGKQCHSQIIKDEAQKELSFPKKRLLKAIKRVQTVNEKLVAFERGFISEEGIKDREWYKHLGVAPGKWLGYGATTLPGLTEAITMDESAAAAALEAARLNILIDNLAERIAL